MNDENKYNRQHNIISTIIATINSYLDLGIPLEQNAGNYSDDDEGENESESSDGSGSERPSEPEVPLPRQQ